MATFLAVLLLALPFAFPAPHSGGREIILQINRGPPVGGFAAPGGPIGEGCGPEDDMPVNFRMAQLARWSSCPPLSKEDCMFLHEAVDKCPCICRKRISGINPRGNPHHRPGQFPPPEGPPQGADYDRLPETPPPAPPPQYGPAPSQPDHGPPSGGQDYGPDDNLPPAPDPDAYGGDYPDEGDGALLGGGRRGGYCFHGSSLVETKSGAMRMEELARAMESGKKFQILTWNRAEDRFDYSPVQFWIHAEPNTKATLRNLSTETGKSLLLTGNHLIYRSQGCRGPTETVFASRLRVGDCVVTGGGERDALVGISEVEKTGMYAPVTEEGSVVVNGVAASCYANVESENVSRMIFSYVHKLRHLFSHVAPPEFLDAVLGKFSTEPAQKLSEVFASFVDLQKYFA